MTSHLFPAPHINPSAPEDFAMFHLTPLRKTPSRVFCIPPAPTCASGVFHCVRLPTRAVLGRRHALLRALLAVGVLSHCDAAKSRSLHAALEGVGVVDTPVGEPLDLRILCDPSEGSPCGTGTAALTIEHVARVAFNHPGSNLTVHVQGDRPADTRALAMITVPAAVDRGERAMKAAEDRFVASVRAAVCAPLDTALMQRRPRQSPIVEAFDEIALSKSASRPVEVFAVTDLREVSALGDFECDRTLPSLAAFAARLRRHGLLQPGTLARVRVHVVTGDHEAVPRRECPVSMGRERELQTLWDAALRGAGATDVTFAPDVPSIETVTSYLTPATALATDAGTMSRRPQ